ncbi:MAG: hypothetical protein KKI12_07075 [Proteobacteria bacterium]|nr:hypothetical protein [Pseudomonadota bacterium]
MNPTRLYLQKEKEGFSPLLWFHNFKFNEMMFGIYGLNQKQSKLTLEFPEYVLSDNELEAVNYKYEDASPINKQLDHITCHGDGKFHLKTKNEDKDLYIHELKSITPLGPDVPIFLQFQILSDAAENYTISKKSPKKPSAQINLSGREYIVLRGAFSGINYELEKEMAHLLALLNDNKPFVQQAVTLKSNSFQGLFFWQKGILPDHAKNSRPPGTFASFMFSVENNMNLIKTFVFE